MLLYEYRNNITKHKGGIFLMKKEQIKGSKQNERGITLVALIITIIILIILVAVTINSLTHNGLADLAIKSTEKYDKAQTDEMNMLNQIDNMTRELEVGLNKPVDLADYSKYIGKTVVGYKPDGAHLPPIQPIQDIAYPTNLQQMM